MLNSVNVWAFLSRRFTVKFHGPFRGVVDFFYLVAAEQKRLIATFTYYLKMQKLSSGHIVLSDYGLSKCEVMKFGRLVLPFRRDFLLEAL